jgi:hypothetical protein
MAAALALLQHHQYSVSDISPGLLFSLLDDDLQRFLSVGQGGRPRLQDNRRFDLVDRSIADGRYLFETRSSSDLLGSKFLAAP